MIAAVIPLKRLGEAKSRLVPALSPEERRALVLRLLSGVQTAIQRARVVERIALVTPEVGLAEQLGVEELPDAGSLNASLVVAIEWSRAIGAEGLLILPADLPLITAEDVRALVQGLPPGEGIALARTTDGGTGGLILRPPNVIPPAFGPNSAAAHLAAATRQGIPAHLIDTPGLAQDLDTVEDLASAFHSRRT